MAGVLSHVDWGPTGQNLLDEDALLTAVLNEAANVKVPGKASNSFNKKNRRCKPLCTPLLKLFPALLDDQLCGMVQLLLRRIHHWEFNAFLLDRFSNGHSLSTLCMHLFHMNGEKLPISSINIIFAGLMSSFSMDPIEVISFFRLVERGYQTRNPYHTSLHAADVTQAMSVFCNQPCLAPHLTKLELLAVLTAAMCHDLDHPGVNEKFLTSTANHLAVLYDNVSVLENHHWRSGISCFVESGLSKYLTNSQFTEFTDLVRSLVLATDISRQQEFLTQFSYFLDTGQIDTSQPDHRQFMLQIAIKCADISNPCRTWRVSRLWSLRACEEFFRQGDSERELGLTVTPICDRFNMTVAKVQVGFYRFVAEPLFKEWHRFLNCPLSEEMLSNLYSNQAVWEQEVLKEETKSATPPTKQPIKECLQNPILPFPAQTRHEGQRRRLSLPTIDPLHQMFDRMTQPDNDFPRGGQLRRNFSLTDRRRSSLHRGLHSRNSLKLVRARRIRPSSLCLDLTEFQR